MYTIRQAARLTGVPEASLRAWERRYSVVTPDRSDSGYRLYDEGSLAVLSTMRRLVDDGWSPAAAAEAVRGGTVPAVLVPLPHHDAPTRLDQPVADRAREQFLGAAIRMDAPGIEDSLDSGFALGTFEHVVDTWLFPALEAMGESWARGELDVAAEHAASHAVHRRLAAAFQAAGSRARGPAVVVGLPPGSSHELGALAFATAIRRRGMNVVYLGADVPAASWQAAVRSCSAHAAVLAVVTAGDRPSASEVARGLLTQGDVRLVCAGGASGADLASGVTTLASSIAAAAHELDELTYSPRS